jgi:hypothetical protein
MARGLDSGGQGEAALLAAVADEEGNRALHLAAAAGKVEVCRYIVEDLRLDVDQLNLKGSSSSLVPLASISHLFLVCVRDYCVLNTTRQVAIYHYLLVTTM